MDAANAIINNNGFFSDEFAKENARQVTSQADLDAKCAIYGHIREINYFDMG